MFRVYHSNQLDVLKSLLAHLIQLSPLQPALAAETILVQSPGMAQWLKQALAQDLGVAANITFPLPSSFIWQMFHQVLPEVPQENPTIRSNDCAAPPTFCAALPSSDTILAVLFLFSFRIWSNVSIVEFMRLSSGGSSLLSVCVML